MCDTTGTNTVWSHLTLAVNAVVTGGSFIFWKPRRFRFLDCNRTVYLTI